MKKRNSFFLKKTLRIETSYFFFLEFFSNSNHIQKNKNKVFVFEDKNLPKQKLSFMRNIPQNIFFLQILVFFFFLCKEKKRKNIYLINSLKTLKKSKFFEDLYIDFLKKQKNDFFNKNQRLKFQKAFFSKKRKIKRFFFHLFLNRNEKNSSIFLQKRLNFKNLFIEFFFQYQFSFFSILKNFRFQIQKNFQKKLFRISESQNPESTNFLNISKKKQRKFFINSQNFFLNCFFFLSFLSSFFFKGGTKNKKQRFLFLPIGKKLSFSFFKIKKIGIFKKKSNLLFSLFSNSSIFQNLSVLKKIYIPEQNQKLAKERIFILKKKNKFKNFLKVNQFFEIFKTYQKFQIFNSLNISRNILQIFENCLPLNFLKFSKDFSQTKNFQKISNLKFKFPFFTVHGKLKKKAIFANKGPSIFKWEELMNSFFFSNLFFFVSKIENYSLSSPSRREGEREMKSIHLIDIQLKNPSLFENQKTLVFDLFLEKSKGFFQFQKKKSLNFNFHIQNIEKTFFHSFLVMECKQKNFFTKSVFFNKHDFFPLNFFLFLNKAFKNSKFSLFLIYESILSNFLFFNDEFLVFFQKNNLSLKLAQILEKFVLLKNMSISKICKSNFVEPLNKTFLFFETKNRKFWKKNEPFLSIFKNFSSLISKSKKQTQNFFIFQNIFWLLSKKFVFLQTKFRKSQFFQNSPIFSCFLGLNHANFKIFLKEKLVRKKKSTIVDNTKEKIFFEKISKNQKAIRKKAILFKQQRNLYKHKAFQQIFLKKCCFQPLKFDGYLFNFSLKYGKQIQNCYFFEKNPTLEKIKNHFKECKEIVKNSIGKKEFYLMKKLHKKIQTWCKKYKTISNTHIFDYCDSMLFKILWNWAKKTHPNKGKLWIRKKYFHFIHSKKWLFGKKFKKNFVCLPLHSQTKTTKPSKHSIDIEFL